MAFDTFKRGWNWFVDGLSEALIWSRTRVSRGHAYAVHVAEGRCTISAPDGSAIGQIVVEGKTAAIEPASLRPRLTGAALDLHVPFSWLFRRNLDAVAVQSAPYLDAFVRHQIDKITPWRVADVLYEIVPSPLPGDPKRLAVEIGVMPRRLVQPLLDGFEALRPGRVRIVAGDPSGSSTFKIRVGDQVPPHERSLRRRVEIGLVALILSAVSAIGWAWWETGIVQDEIADQDQIIEQRKAILAATGRREQAGAEADSALRRLRASRPKAVDILEALSQALPDSAYLTALTVQKDQVAMSGVAKDLPQLVPALEASHQFRNPVFSEATTRLESGEGDRFHMQTQAAATRQEAARP